MSNAKKLAVAVLALAFCASAPVMAADAASTAAEVAKPDIAGAMKEKAASAVKEKAASAVKEQVDSAADKLKKSLGADKLKDANEAVKGTEEVVNIQQESVTIETPQGTATETTTTIVPETPAAPAK